MSRLHTTLASVGEVATHFGAALPQGHVHFARETTEGADGLVVFESRGRRLLRSMGWGFPRLTREMREQGEDPQRLGLVADLTNPMWEHMVVDPRYRCLIVLTHFANPDGMPGHKTRTWFSVKHTPVMAWAGFCRNLPDYGPVYAGMTMAANAAVMPTNDRMPVLLDPMTMTPGRMAASGTSSVFSIAGPLVLSAWSSSRQKISGAAENCPHRHSRSLPCSERCATIAVGRRNRQMRRCATSIPSD